MMKCMSADATTEIWTIRRLLEWTVAWLTRRGVAEARLSAEVLLAHALSCDRIWLYARFDEVPPAEQVAVFRDLVRRAGEHTPIAYLVGKKEFYSLTFEVTAAVLIPRPETETLVDRVVQLGRSGTTPVRDVWDVGTGSGCIAVAVCKQLPEVRCLASDVSADALSVAARNVARHGLADRIRLVEADGLSITPRDAPDHGFDVLVSNPPYISTADLPTLDATVRDYEPSVALSAGDDGMRFFRMLAERAGRWVREGGALLVEFGYGQVSAVRQIVEAGGAFVHTGTWRDAASGHERVMQFERRSPARPGDARTE